MDNEIMSYDSAKTLSAGIWRACPGTLLPLDII